MKTNMKKTNCQEKHILMIQTTAFIAIYSYENSPGLFYICKVIKSDTAMKITHIIFSKYLLCSYITIQEKLKKFQGKSTIYKLVKDGVYIIPKQVFYPCVNILDKLTLELKEYQFQCDCLLQISSPLNY